MVKKDTLLSIIIPIYNVEKYIRECLDSTLSCKSNEYEIIIVNDGTPDNSMSIVYEYFKIYGNKIKIVEQKNRGLSIARNNGINNAEGEYIWCVDSDDYITEDAIDYILTLIKSKNIEIIAMPLKHCYINGYKKNDFTINNNITITGSNYLKKKLPLGASQRYIIKKSFLEINDLYFMPNKLHEDGDFGLRLLYYAQNVYVTNKSLYNYRIRENGSIMSSWKRKNSEDLILIHDKLFDLFIQNPLNINTRPFFDATFHILTASILFAYKKWDSKEFQNFYYTNKIELINRAKKIRHYCTPTLKKTLKIWLFIVSPLFCCKTIIHKQKL